MCKVFRTGKIENEVCNEFTEVGEDAFERVGKFCYLGDLINADEGAEFASVMRTSCAGQKFQELSPILTGKYISLKLKGRVYETFVRSAMLYGSETMKVEQETRLSEPRCK